jgi:hypothetical protein
VTENVAGLGAELVETLVSAAIGSDPVLTCPPYADNYAKGVRFAGTVKNRSRGCSMVEGMNPTAHPELECKRCSSFTGLQDTSAPGIR